MFVLIGEAPRAGLRKSQGNQRNSGKILATNSLELERTSHRLEAGLKLPRIDPGKFVTIAKVAPTGSLQARRGSSGGIQFFWRYSLGPTS